MPVAVVAVVANAVVGCCSNSLENGKWLLLLLLSSVLLFAVAAVAVAVVEHNSSNHFEDDVLSFRHTISKRINDNTATLKPWIGRSVA